MSHNARGANKHNKSHHRRQFSKKQGFKNNRASQGGPREYHHKNQFLETDVGITEFISTLDGFCGVIKARFSDFQVSEIDLEGRVAKLSDQTIPNLRDKKKDDDNKLVDVAVSPLKTIPQEKWDEIKTMMEAPSKDDDNETKNIVRLEINELTKDDRGEIHKTLKSAFGTKLSATTITLDNGNKIMEIKKSDGKNNNERFQWPQDKGEYVHFLLYKESIDTLEACLKISDCLRMSASNFTYAGVKDRRSKSTQWLSVRKVEPWKLMIKTKPIRNIKIGNITFKDAPLKLGDLSGNRFRIALRNVTGNDELINKSLESLKERGFINYYGLQRFGNDKETPTFAIGQHLLLGNWKEACDLILKQTDGDDVKLDTTKAKKVYADTENAEKALKEFDTNKNKAIEYFLLKGLSEGHKNDYVTALESIPRNTRLLYIHALQSLIWNKVVSYRIKQFGLEPREGDLILSGEQEQEIEGNNEDSNVDNKKIKVKALSADDCRNYTIYDIVLPLPGYDIEYPENVKEFYAETLKEYGLTLEMPKQRVQAYTLSGTYRKVVERVKNLSWKIMHYNDPNYNLIRSDLEELKKYEEPRDLPDGKYKALVLDFVLNSSSYATMVLREILKTDTSSSSHAKLNNYHKQDIEEKTAKEEDNEEETLNDQQIGLLGDSEKYEAFKNFVFNDESESNKRKLDDDYDTNNKDAKNIKTE